MLRIYHGNEELGVHIFPGRSYDSVSLNCYTFSHHGLTSVVHTAKQQHRYTLHIAVALFWSSSNGKKTANRFLTIQNSAVTCLFNYCHWSLVPVLYLYIYKHDLQAVSQNSFNMAHILFHCSSCIYTPRWKVLNLTRLYFSNKQEDLLILYDRFFLEI